MQEWGTGRIGVVVGAVNSTHSHLSHANRHGGGADIFKGIEEAWDSDAADTSDNQGDPEACQLRRTAVCLASLPTSDRQLCASYRSRYSYTRPSLLPLLQLAAYIPLHLDPATTKLKYHSSSPIHLISPKSLKYELPVSFTSSSADNSSSKANSSLSESSPILSSRSGRYDSTLSTVTSSQSAPALSELATHHLSFYKDVFLTHRISSFSSFSSAPYSPPSSIGQTADGKRDYKS